jgi:hypothetical protein
LPYPQEAVQGCRGARLRARRGSPEVPRSKQPPLGRWLMAKDFRQARMWLLSGSAASTAKLPAVSRRGKRQICLSSTFLLVESSQRAPRAAQRAFSASVAVVEAFRDSDGSRSSATKRNPHARGLAGVRVSRTVRRFGDGRGQAINRPARIKRGAIFGTPRFSAARSDDLLGSVGGQTILGTPLDPAYL